MDTSNPIQPTVKDPKFKAALLSLAGILTMLATLPQHLGFVISFLPAKYASIIAGVSGTAVALIVALSQWFPEYFHPTPPSGSGQ